jgi:hypothetical protein
MRSDKTTISASQDYAAIGEYWDRHDLAEHWAETSSADFEVDVRSQTTYFAVDTSLSEQLRESAARRGISAETLVNLWLQERIGRDSFPT